MPVKNRETLKNKSGWRQWLMLVTIIVVASTASSLVIYFQTQPIREGVGELLVSMKKMNVDLSGLSDQLRVFTERLDRADYQTEITVQQEVIPRVSAELSYIHRTFHGFFVTQNLNRDVTTDYASYTINAPMDPRLPGGGGYPILVYAPIVTGAADNFLTHESRYSSDGHERDAYFDGVNFNVNARMRGGLFVSAGTQTGRRVDDQCNVQPFLTGGGGPNPRGCFDADPWQTTVRGLGSYTIPRIDVLVSATVRSEPPLQLDAEWAVPNTCVGAGCVSIQNALGFLPPGTNPNGNTTIDLFDDTMRLYADNRRTQVDMRFAKVFRFGGTRTDIGVDLWNLFNTNYATGYEDTYSFTQPNGGQWIEPTSIYAPRFVRLNFTVNF
jgi:hypothetical protein